MPKPRSSSRASSSLRVERRIVMFMPCTRVNLSGFSSGKHQLLRQAQAVVAVAVEGVGVQAAKVAHAGQGQRNQPIQELVHPRPRSVTLQPIAMPSRSRKVGDALAALQRSGFWPVISASARDASSRCFLSLIAAADAHVDHDLFQPRQREPVLAAELFRERGHDLLLETAGAAGAPAAGRLPPAACRLPILSVSWP